MSFQHTSPRAGKVGKFEKKSRWLGNEINEISDFFTLSEALIY
jgi:hypothetical protein